MKKHTFTLITLALSFCTSSNICAQAGSLDSTFGNNGKVTTRYGDYSTQDNVEVQQNGKIVISAIDFGGVAILRYDTDGTLDKSFGNNGIAEKIFPYLVSNAFSTAPFIMLSDETFIVAASIDNNEGLTDIALTKFTSNGIIDSSFGEDGTVVTSKHGFSLYVNDIALQEDGKIIVGGTAEHGRNSRFMVIRYNVDGTPDSTFDDSGLSSSPIIDDVINFDDIAIQPDGKILALGHLFDGGLVLSRITEQGKPDLSFGQKGFIRMSIARGLTQGHAIAVQADGKILITGETLTNHLRDIILVRLQSNGSRDTTFGNNGVSLISYPGHELNLGHDLKIQQDGKILVAGVTAPTYSSESADFLLVRCNDNGVVDETFGTNGFSITDFGTDYDWAYGLTLQTDGKIVVSGSGSDIYLARYKNDDLNSPELISKLSNDIISHHRGINIYPNPIKSVMNIKGLDANSQSILTVTNASGKVVSRVIASGDNYSMNVNHLPAGLYVLNVYSKNKTVSLKFMKE